MTFKNTKSIRPFITWVGGKRRVASQLSSLIPKNINNYYEPFLGGGALFFSVFDKFKKYYLSDINLELVTSYNAIKNNPELVEKLLQKHEHNNKEYFYQMRDTNCSNDPSEIGARFIYLNRYSFRGIYRISKNNQSTATFSGRTYKNSIKNILKESSKALAKTTICANDFSFIGAQENDFVYFDPPYHQSGESFYTRIPFSQKDQIRLRDFASKLTESGVKLMISNSNSEFIKTIYDNQDFCIKEMVVDYHMRNSNRRSTELIITNYNPK